MVDMLGCRSCGRWFPNLDNSMVCPNCGTETDGDTDEDDDHIPARAVTG
jgi:rRNA maturation endonuclease Nob1